MHQRAAASSRSATRRQTWSMRRRLSNPSQPPRGTRPPGDLDTICGPEGTRQGGGMSAQADRRALGLARLAELGDEPGGDAFIERMGDLGDWIVDFVFGDVHARPGLAARERELIILAVLTTIGSSDPQVRAHIRAARAIDVPFEEIEEAILQTAP